LSGKGLDFNALEGEGEYCENNCFIQRIKATPGVRVVRSSLLRPSGGPGFYSQFFKAEARRMSENRTWIFLAQGGLLSMTPESDFFYFLFLNLALFLQAN